MGAGPARQACEAGSGAAAAAVARPAVWWDLDSLRMLTLSLRFPAVVAALFGLILTSAAAADVPAAIQAGLARGVNLSFWFTYRDNPSIDPQLFWPVREDLVRLRAAGFRHVRVPFERAWLADPANPSRIAAERAGEYAAALEMAAAQGLLVVATLTANNDDLARMLRDKAWRDTVAAFWWSLAKFLAPRLGPDRLVFEVLNEPANDDAAASQQLMQTLAGAVRDAAPAHTLVVGGHKYSGVDELLQLKPLLDRNVVYTFHFYEPMNFTHQGAWWGWPMWAKLRGLPYPSAPALVEALLPALDAEAQPHARYYGQQEWNRARLAAILDKVAQWQAANRVPVWCSEFGVIKTVTPVDSRIAWLRDTRSLLEERHIGWTHFDFVQHMGIADGPRGQRRWDARALAALGLTAPP